MSMNEEKAVQEKVILQIEEGQNFVMREIEKLEKSVAEIETRLKVVLLSPSPEGKAEESKDVERCELGRNLLEDGYRIQKTVESLNSILQRLQLQ